jgi:hypothetical protein
VGLVVGLVLGCAPTELGAAGARVIVAEVAPPGCASLGQVRASAGYNGRGTDSNDAGVTASLRNDAAALGGDTLVVTSRTRGAAPVDPLAPRAGMTSGGCPSCVSATAVAYRCGVAPKPAPASGASALAEAAKVALAAAADRARTCVPTSGAAHDGVASGPKPRPPSEPTGEATLHVTFAATGDVVYAEVTGAGFAGTPIAACMEDKLRHARIPASTSAPPSLSITLSFPPRTP